MSNEVFEFEGDAEKASLNERCLGTRFGESDNAFGDPHARIGYGHDHFARGLRWRIPPPLFKMTTFSLEDHGRATGVAARLEPPCDRSCASALGSVLVQFAAASIALRVPCTIFPRGLWSLASWRDGSRRSTAT